MDASLTELVNIGYSSSLKSDIGLDSSGKLRRHIRHKHTEFIGYEDLKQNMNVKYDKKEASLKHLPAFDFDKGQESLDHILGSEESLECKFWERISDSSGEMGRHIGCKHTRDGEVLLSMADLDNLKIGKTNTEYLCFHCKKCKRKFNKEEQMRKHKHYLNNSGSSSHLAEDDVIAGVKKEHIDEEEKDLKEDPDSEALEMADQTECIGSDAKQLISVSSFQYHRPFITATLKIQQNKIGIIPTWQLDTDSKTAQSTSHVLFTF